MIDPIRHTPPRFAALKQLAHKVRTWIFHYRKRLLFSAALMLAIPLLWLASLWPQTELVSPPSTALYEDRHGTFLAESGEQELGFWDVPLEQSRVGTALIAIEDKRFHRHAGVDLRAIGRALRNNLEGGPRQGASTLAMQVARMQGGHNSRGYGRKFTEMALAWMMTARHGRTAILAHYLKIVPQGNRMHGVAYAARRYFQKPLQDLSWAEASLLAALPKAPGRMNLYKRSGREAARKRGHRILRLLFEEGWLNRTELLNGQRQLDALKIPLRQVRPFNAAHAILQLEQLPTRSFYTGPVRTTLDLELQDKLDDMAFHAIEQYRRLGAGNIAVVLADRHRGDLLAYVGSDFYGDPRNAGSIDYANTRRSSGSTLKPFLYGLGLEDKHFSPASVLDDLPLHITHKGGHYTARNYDEGYLGPMLYGRALANSRNIPALTVLRKVGLGRAHERLRQLGLGDPDIQPGHYGLGLAIGGMYVTLHELVQAYGSLANDGYAFQTRWLQSQPGGIGHTRIFPQQVARQITGFLSDPTARLPGFPQLEFPFPVAIKTGTSQGFRDAWAVAYSADYILGIWVGHPDHVPMKELGGINVAHLAKKMMLSLHPQQVRGIHETPFPKPQHQVMTQLCPLTGQLATAHCSEVAEVGLLPHQVPTENSGVHQMFAVDRRDGQPANASTPAAQVTMQHKLVLPPRYAVWARQQGLVADPTSEEKSRRASIAVRAPVSGGRFRIDPSVPRKFQTLALTAEVTPAVPEVMWYVNDKLVDRVGYPYVSRWKMEPGEHRIEARFAHADIRSQSIVINVQ